MHMTCWVKGLDVCVGARASERRLESAKKPMPGRWKSMCEGSEVCSGDQKKARVGVGDGGGGERRQLRMGGGERLEHSVDLGFWSNGEPPGRCVLSRGCHG